jgi:hypothetical protein
MAGRLAWGRSDDARDAHAVRVDQRRQVVAQPSARSDHDRTNDSIVTAPNAELARSRGDSARHVVCCVSLAMGKAKCAFTKTALKRALQGAKEAGVDVQIVIDQERKTMTIAPVKVNDFVERDPRREMTGEGDWDNI